MEKELKQDIKKIEMQKVKMKRVIVGLLNSEIALFDFEHTLMENEQDKKYYPDMNVCSQFKGNYREEIHNKLGQLEDIEEELGIDLITLFKLINAKNIYSYGHSNIMKNSGQVNIYDKTITIWNGTCHIEYSLSEYGKSFALTKEELI